MNALRSGLALLMGTLMLLSAGGTAHAQAANTVTGTVTYLQRIALPPSAVITVRLLNISVADAPMNVVAEQRITGRGVPAPFSITYNPSDIAPNGSYALTAEIRDADKLLFSSNQLYSVINNGVTNVDMILQMISAPVSGPPGMPPTGEATGLTPIAWLAIVFAAALLCSGALAIRHLRRG